MEDLALRKLAALGDVRTFDELCPDYRSRPMQGARFDVDPGAGRGWLVHMGKQLELSADEQGLVIAHLRGPEGLPDGLPTSFMCYRHTVANIHGDQLATSLAHRRSITRISSYVMVRWVRTG